MNAEDLVLNIAVNMGRLATWVSEKRLHRVDQFLAETDMYIQELQKKQLSVQFQPTYEKFIKSFQSLKSNANRDLLWAEDALTWANILTHRAKLA